MHQLDIEAVGVHRRIRVADLAEEPGHGVVEPAEIPHVEHDALLIVLEVRGGDRHGDGGHQASRQRPADGPRGPIRPAWSGTGFVMRLLHAVT